MNLGGWQRFLAQADTDQNNPDGTLSERIDQARTYVDNRLYRAEVVNPLPLNAEAGRLMVTPGDIHLYVGAGLGSPLRKIPTVPL